ncbi:hypothetical protein [Methanococcoides burtonii]|uniref:Uncharacterized protein n=1 Tax=Methanococcoides burtonii (strain DSM 6242 / NBRC 107633 / OCM 468 / ACE-M) TaxID=259564 RepID=Q12Z79_METBU|nr:hypothetical protein [Methanococcoides burtonii]ABE51247.1 Hypothetical protein Mbur_0237 [Methanococcoides burtonii DSM 6242]
MKLSIKFLIILLILSAFTANACADVLFPGTRGIDRCVKIVNLEEFPEIVLVGHIAGPIIQCENPYIISSNKCLTKFYKANDLTIYAIDKDYLEAKGLDNIDLESDPNLCFYEVEINPKWNVVKEEDPLTREEVEYSIAGFSEDRLVLYTSRKVSEYNDGSPDRIETFEEPDIPNIRLTIKENTSFAEKNTSSIKENLSLNEETVPDVVDKKDEGILASIIRFLKGLV